MTTPSATHPTIAEAITAIKMAKAAHPRLCCNGMGLGDNWRDIKAFEKDRNNLSPANVATAIAYLRQCRPAKRPIVSSYHLKHLAERWGRENGVQPYIANGELIAAAVFVGLKIGAPFQNYPNVGVAVRGLPSEARGRTAWCV
jgi:hypothetical protein